MLTQIGVCLTLLSWFVVLCPYLFACWVNLYAFVVICRPFSVLTFLKILSATLSVLDPYQDQHYVGPDLGQDYLQRLSADDKMTKKVAASKERTAMNLVTASFIFRENELMFLVSCLLA